MCQKLGLGDQNIIQVDESQEGLHRVAQTRSHPCELKVSYRFANCGLWSYKDFILCLSDFQG